MNIFKALVKETKVVLTKTKIKEGKFSAFGVGEKRSGTLSKDFEFSAPLYLKEWKSLNVTSKILSAETHGKKKHEMITLESETSFYDVRIVKDENDEEFQKWLNY